MLHLTFLGTSAGVPTKKRNVTALAIECLNPFGSAGNPASKKNKPWVLVDCGEATQHQLLKTNISSHQLAVICITHVHGDHCYGLPGLLASMAMSGRKESLTIIAPQAIKQFLEAVKATTELYFPFEIEFISIESLFKTTELKQSHTVSVPLSTTHQLDIEVIKLFHRVKSYAFKITQTVQTIKLNIEKLKAEGVEPTAAWGRLQAGKDVTLPNGGQLKSLDYTQRVAQVLKVIVAGDNDNPQLLSEAAKDADLLVHEATYTQAVADKIMSREDAFDPMHTTAKRIASFAHSAQLNNLILTHFSARYQPYDDPESKTPNMADIRLEVEQYYQGNLWLARDFMRFEVTHKAVKQLVN
ncbi:ribonuclease Z [Psychrobacter sp. UBA3962]|uniref:ribonuclease Z n=1 Tax=Psychrobacter sp. UBA3962 TaxID=1947352 RepID=UPI0025D7A191|nr:ribonuclease Z [Psychrobacter sp. UBA3962]